MNLSDSDAAERARDDLQRIVDRLGGNPNAVGNEEVNAYRIAVRIDALCKAAQAGVVPWPDVRCRIDALGASLRDMKPFTASVPVLVPALEVDHDGPDGTYRGARQQHPPRLPRQSGTGREKAAEGKGWRGDLAAYWKTSGLPPLPPFLSGLLKVG